MDQRARDPTADTTVLVERRRAEQVDAHLRSAAAVMTMCIGLAGLTVNSSQMLQVAQRSSSDPNRPTRCSAHP